MSRFNFNEITLQSSADISKVAENFAMIEENAVLKTDTATTSQNGLMTSSDKSKLNNIENNATHVVVDSNIVKNGQNPVIGGAIYQALLNKVDKVNGKGLSTNDYTTEEKTKLASINTALLALKNNELQTDLNSEKVGGYTLDNIKELDDKIVVDYTLLETCQLLQIDNVTLEPNKEYIFYIANPPDSTTGNDEYFKLYINNTMIFSQSGRDKDSIFLYGILKIVPNNTRNKYFLNFMGIKIYGVQQIVTYSSDADTFAYMDEFNLDSENNYSIKMQTYRENSIQAGASVKIYEKRGV